MDAAINGQMDVISKLGSGTLTLPFNIDISRLDELCFKAAELRDVKMI